MTDEEQKKYESLREDQLDDNGINADDYIERAIEFTTSFQDLHSELLDESYDMQLSGLFMYKDDMLELLNNFMADNDDNEDIISNMKEEIKKVQDNNDKHLLKVTLGNSDNAINFAQMSDHIGEDKFIVKRVTDLDKVNAFNIVEAMVSDYQDEMDW